MQVRASDACMKFWAMSVTQDLFKGAPSQTSPWPNQVKWSKINQRSYYHVVCAQNVNCGKSVQLCWRLQSWRFSLLKKPVWLNDQVMPQKLKNRGCIQWLSVLGCILCSETSASMHNFSGWLGSWSHTWQHNTAATCYALWQLHKVATDLLDTA